MNPLRRLARWLNPPDPLAGYSVSMRIRTPDESTRPITLVLGDDGIVRWEYRDTEGQA